MATKAKKREEKICQQDVMKKYGFNAAMLELLPEPELVKKRWRKHPMKLWLVKDVVRVLKTKRAQTLLAESIPRRESAKKAVETKRKQMEARIEKAIAEIRVDNSKPIKSIMENSYQQAMYYCRQREHERGFYYDGEPTEEDRLRWAVNYVRHKLTVYDEVLYSTQGKVGCHEGYCCYKKAVLAAIGEAYPELKAEAERQAEYLN